MKEKRRKNKNTEDRCRCKSAVSKKKKVESRISRLSKKKPETFKWFNRREENQEKVENGPGVNLSLKLDKGRRRDKSCL